MKGEIFHIELSRLFLSPFCASVVAMALGIPLRQVLRLKRQNGDANKNISPQIVDFQPLRQGIFFSQLVILMSYIVT